MATVPAHVCVAPVRFGWGGEGERREGRATQTCDAMPVTWSEPEREWAETKVCSTKHDNRILSGVAIEAIMKMLLPTWKRWYSLTFVAFNHTLNHSCREKVVVVCVWSKNSNCTKKTRMAKGKPCIKPLLQDACVLVHKGQECTLMDYWVQERGLVLCVSLSVVTTSMKALSSKQRQCNPRWSGSHPSHYPNSTYRRALFSGGLTLNGQRN